MLVAATDGRSKCSRPLAQTPTPTVPVQCDTPVRREPRDGPARSALRSGCASARSPLGTVLNQVLCLGPRKIHERARCHGQVLANRIDEMPVTLEGEAFDV